jgi:hypothetical protein
LSNAIELSFGDELDHAIDAEVQNVLEELYSVRDGLSGFLCVFLCLRDDAVESSDLLGHVKGSLDDTTMISSETYSSDCPDRPAHLVS